MSGVRWLPDTGHRTPDDGHGVYFGVVSHAGSSVSTVTWAHNRTTTRLAVRSNRVGRPLNDAAEGLDPLSLVEINERHGCDPIRAAAG